MPSRFACVIPLVCASAALSGAPAPTPPMGWNSWDSFGLTITEAEFRENVHWLAGNLKNYGWQYAVVDEGWYLKNPEGAKGSFRFTMDEKGRYLPASNRFPSGFKTLADAVHALGLKFGIHIIRGIPREAVEKDLPIADSQFRSAEAADRFDTCQWNADNYGVKYTPAGQAYYDSMARLYASWGLDFIKVDCIAASPYKGDEIRMISQALRKSGRTIVLSLSPGPAPLDKVGELRDNANMWRISNDIWDHWKPDKQIAYSPGILGQFEVTASWAGFVKPEHWPDADMLPLGYLGPRPGAGKPRDSRLTHDEQRTLMTLWCIFRSPLFMGGNLTRMDDWTKSLLSNPEVLAVDQHSWGGRQVSNDNGKVVWVAKDQAGGGAYVALFNLSDSKKLLEYPLQSLGTQQTAFAIRDVWERRDLRKGRFDKS